MINIEDALKLKAVYHDFGKWELLYIDGDYKIFPSRWFNTKEELDKFVIDTGLEAFYHGN